VGLLLIPVVVSVIPMPTAHHLQHGHTTQEEGEGKGQMRVAEKV